MIVSFSIVTSNNNIGKNLSLHVHRFQAWSRNFENGCNNTELINFLENRKDVTFIYIQKVATTGCSGNLFEVKTTLFVLSIWYRALFGISLTETLPYISHPYIGCTLLFS